MKIRALTHGWFKRVAIATILAASLCAGRGASWNTNDSAWPGADLFVDRELPRIEIAIAPEEARKLQAETREFVHATLTEAGVRYTGVAVHLKGSIGSFRSLDDKPAFTLDFARFHPGQRFHQLRRIHLNNSVEDPSYCNEQLGGELFRAARIPAPRVGRVMLSLNGQPWKLYVLKEGFTEDFLGCYFQHVGGGLFEPGEGHDVNQHLKRASLAAPGGPGRVALQKLAAAALTADAVDRWNKLEAVLDADEFVKFMAMEVMICHRDGYSLARNNFRIYHNIDTRKVLFLPHGMDQLFGSAELPTHPKMAGLVADVVLATPEGSARYKNVFEELFKHLFRPTLLTNRVNEIVATLRPTLEATEFAQVSEAAASLNQHIAQRWSYLNAELGRPGPSLEQFVDGQSGLKGWMKGPDLQGAELDEEEIPGTSTWLHISTTQETTGSWRTKAFLPPGQYIFEGKVRVVKVNPLPFGQHQGAGLRVAGVAQWSRYLVNDSDWEVLQTPFEVKDKPQEVEFICELRASSGEVWFDETSLKVIRRR